MKIGIVGSRSFTNYKLFITYLTAVLIDNSLTISEIISGGAKGIDSLAKQFAADYAFPIVEFKPDYARYGRFAAPKMRNTQIIEASDVIVAFWDGVSGGTKDSIAKAKKAGKPVITITFDKES